MKYKGREKDYMIKEWKRGREKYNFMDSEKNNNTYWQEAMIFTVMFAEMTTGTNENATEKTK